LGLDLNDDPPEFVEDIEKEENLKDQVTGQQIKRPRKNSGDDKL